MHFIKFTKAANVLICLSDGESKKKKKQQRFSIKREATKLTLIRKSLTTLYKAFKLMYMMHAHMKKNDTPN